jgi:hypothetical protein
VRYILCVLFGVFATVAAVACWLCRRVDKRADDEADRRAIETYEAWKRDPSGAVPLEDFEAALGMSE